ncbi:hypothetical protein GE21DRAFT_1351 [Neurospora crassa]|uniref:Uncharacterized protein n=1 Tax=Neurospora crassa (strain ATCC 24698 / 74-OR23-1A / CBS 708.71 / DSM 1257 / FGSC 987) TaxID=367110 RepID=Q7SDW9_NEUCR|nr:hypothetical protein NCU03286 [Neurospora crassa OR74A]EAA34976.1 hypothetical protein NCU03286 [Neurospora crassa OR74A]KHE78537.1 hypothetical protein GE21DRAFT_1351 [Neurospora crassa]|eukprot:XP_964212.1 hypothetical protein NCU03286 [Neurospora crassa OR74A]
MPPHFSKRPRRLRPPGSRQSLQQLTYSGYFPSRALDDVDGTLKDGRFCLQKRQVFVTQLDQVLEVDNTGSRQLETGTDCGYGGGVVEGDIEEESFEMRTIQRGNLEERSPRLAQDNFSCESKLKAGWFRTRL